jgi:four helix bundle protein
MSDFGDEMKQRTKAFALRVIKMTGSLPRSAAGRVLGDQALRSGTSVGANYREAYRARSKAEFVAKIGDCLKEAEETAYWFELIVDAGLLKPNMLTPLQEECSKLIGVFVSIQKRGRGPRNL